ncbi:hypothetical protein GC093_30390 [Paenibacillus sp. LMG 31456]|uniref:Uncharacterized protein n=1 Tax=Paenibacillus foliorum TaxID=2654974 RepID=A0A972H6X3_9BACL|nr:hypothetical protein [Paenibacillus foliorum]
MKLAAILGIMVGVTGSVWLAMIGLQHVNNFGSDTSDYHNGILLIKYGSAFTLIFLVTLWLMNKNVIASCIQRSHLVIGIDMAKDAHVAQATNFRGIVLSKRHLTLLPANSHTKLRSGRGTTERP